MPESLFRTSSLTKRYGSVTVLDGVDFDVRAGEMHGLLGANGAGKSTLCKILAGLATASEGSMTLKGLPYGPETKREAERRGVNIVQQELNLVPTLSVAENLQLGCLPSWGGVLRMRTLHCQARKILDRFGLSDVATETRAGDLGVGRQQMVEIAAALAQRCQLLILDEPTAALSGSESSQLFAWLDELRDQGVGMIYVSHRLDEVAQQTDRLTVLRDGKLVCTKNTSATTTDQMVYEMTGGSRQGISDERRHDWIQPRLALRVESLNSGLVHNVSFDVQCGERLGIAGLVGAGRTELLRAIFGADPATSGQVSLGEAGRPQRFTTPAAAVRAGLAMVTEDRKQNGLLLPQSIRVNTTLATLADQFSKGGVIRQNSECLRTQRECNSLEISCQDIEQSVDTLSGGNQQKVVVAKWLLRNADVLLLDEPTRGIDVATRQRIYVLLESLAAEGKGVIIASSDLEELLENCDRIAVMSAGYLVAMFARGNWSEEEILRAAFSKHRTEGAGAEPDVRTQEPTT